jgi:hypothetical protein
MHPGSIGIAAETLYQIKILLCADSLIVLSLDQRFSHSEKSFLIVVHIFFLSESGVGRCVMTWYMYQISSAA